MTGDIRRIERFYEREYMVREWTGDRVEGWSSQLYTSPGPGSTVTRVPNCPWLPPYERGYGRINADWATTAYQPASGPDVLHETKQIWSICGGNA